MIEVHYWPTPNGKKVTILLEELGVPYEVVPVNIGRGDQFEDRFLSISPNNRMPAIVDTAPKGGGPPIGVFESGAILFYLAEKEGRFWPQDDARAKYEVAQWVIWQMANQGPKFGERGHFSRMALRADSEKPATFTPSLRMNLERKCSASGRISSTRSRRAGTWTGNTFSR